MTLKLKELQTGTVIKLVGNDLNTYFGDPASAQERMTRKQKTLTVELTRLAENIRHIDMREDATQDIIGVKAILTATLAVPSGGSAMDVADALRSRLIGGTIRLKGLALRTELGDPSTYGERMMCYKLVLSVTLIKSAGKANRAPRRAAPTMRPAEAKPTGPKAKMPNLSKIREKLKGAVIYRCMSDKGIGYRRSRNITDKVPGSEARGPDPGDLIHVTEVGPKGDWIKTDKNYWLPAVIRWKALPAKNIEAGERKVFTKMKRPVLFRCVARKGVGFRRTQNVKDKVPAKEMPGPIYGTVIVANKVQNQWVQDMETEYWLPKALQNAISSIPVLMEISDFTEYIFAAKPFGFEMNAAMQVIEVENDTQAYVQDVKLGARLVTINGDPISGNTAEIQAFLNEQDLPIRLKFMKPSHAKQQPKMTFKTNDLVRLHGLPKQHDKLNGEEELSPK